MGNISHYRKGFVAWRQECARCRWEKLQGLYQNLTCSVSVVTSQENTRTPMFLLSHTHNTQCHGIHEEENTEALPLVGVWVKAQSCSCLAMVLNIEMWWVGWPRVKKGCQKWQVFDIWGLTTTFCRQIQILSASFHRWVNWGLETLICHIVSKCQRHNEPIRGSCSCHVVAIRRD